MENLSSSIESLKSIYLNEIHQDISLELDQELQKAEKSQGFEKITFWKNFAEKWAYVVAQKSPELFEVFTGIINEALEIIECGKKHLHEMLEVDKKRISQKNEELQKNIQKLKKELESKDLETCTKRKCVEEKQNLAMEISSLQLNIEKMQKMITGQEQSKELLCEINELQAKIKKFDENSKELEEDAQKYREQIKNLEEKAKASKVKIKNFKEKMKEFQDDRKDFEDNLKEKEEHLKECFRKIKDQKDQLKLQNLESAKNESQKHENSEKDQEIARLQKELFNLNLQFNGFKQSLVELELETNTTLEKSLNLFQKTPHLISQKSSTRKEIIPKQSAIGQIKLKPQTRELSLKELKETIEDIYESKSKFDQICLENKKPKETMDHYLVSYFTQKYGVKSIIQDYTKLFNFARNKFEKTDAEVLLFSKILSNRIDEFFHFDLAKLKEKLKNKLKQLIQQFNPYMREAQLSQVLKEKMLGNLSQFEWESIVSMFYSKEEADSMISNINEMIEQKEAKLVIGRRNKLMTEKSEITYSEVQNAILAYDLANYEALLEPFWKIFSKLDGDNDGLLTDEQFKVLCSDLGIESETERFLDDLDPLESGFVTFSDCVKQFNEEIIENPGESFNLSVLHYLFFKSQVP